MKIGNLYYCQVCSAEITAEEPNNEFTTGLLASKGHCHSECLAQRNAVLNQYDSLVYTLGALLDPTVESSQKTRQAAEVESKRPRPLNRVPKKPRPAPVLSGISPDTLKEARKLDQRAARASKKAKRAT